LQIWNYTGLVIIRSYRGSGDTHNNGITNT
jgi:hypothetical protein